MEEGMRSIMDQLKVELHQLGGGISTDGSFVGRSAAAARPDVAGGGGSPAERN
jgi:hypothetical protein